MALNLVFPTLTANPPAVRTGIIRGYGPMNPHTRKQETEYHGFGSQVEVDRFNRDAKLGWVYVLDVDPPADDPYFQQKR